MRALSGGRHWGGLPIAQSKILIVEDDPLILMTAAEALRAAGFHVLEAETAEDAVAILHASTACVVAVFSDIETPGALDGLQLARMVREAWPAIPVVLTSGRVKPSEAALPQDVRFVPKPYDPAHIAILILELGAR